MAPPTVGQTLKDSNSLMSKAKEFRVVARAVARPGAAATPTPLSQAKTVERWSSGEGTPNGTIRANCW